VGGGAGGALLDEGRSLHAVSAHRTASAVRRARVVVDIGVESTAGDD
jgi:hypothetical protein